MGGEIVIPVWLAWILGLLALAGLMDRLLMPSVRWVLRRRVNAVIDDMNARLKLKLPPLKLTRRESLIDRLIYDPKVLAAVEEEAAQSGRLREEAMREAREYAREIVPAFNAYFYFRLGYRAARALVRLLYKVRIHYRDEGALARLPKDTTVVFIMNHRSNMDYILVAYLAAGQAALSYAVGEWARVWPLHMLIRAMGAYFIRRDSKSRLYRRVLEAYVRIAVEGGIPQAVYPEGGLSRDGRLRAPKLGLLDYMTKNFDPSLGRDIVFVPVGINYDRVLEDRNLLAMGEGRAPRVGLRKAMWVSAGFLGRNLMQMARKRWRRFGYASAVFGDPLSLKDWLAARGASMRETTDADARFALLQALADDIMGRVADAVPILPIPLMAYVLLNAPPEGLTRDEAGQKAAQALLALPRMDTASPRLDRAGQYPAVALDYALDMLCLRRLAFCDAEGRYRLIDSQRELIAYYARSIETHWPAR